VEARQLPCTLNPREAREWVEFWKRVVDYAVEYADPIHVMDHYERGGIRELQRELLGEAIQVDPLDQEDAEVACMLLSGDEAEGPDLIPAEFADEDEFLDEEELIDDWE
jgi:hypothetical protein